MSMFTSKKILVAVDGSDTARAALRFALELSQSLSCSITAAAVMQTRLPGYRAGYFSFVDRHIIEELRQFSTQVLDEAKQAAAAFSGVTFEPLALEGEDEVFKQLATYLERSPDVVLVVLGSYGHGVGDRHILGSTTERLILEIARHGRKTPVLVVP
jgi:nucleotide-binding universal stress UspA family protein